MLSSLFLSTHQATAEVIWDQMIQRRTSGQDCLKYPSIKYTDHLFLSVWRYIIIKRGCSASHPEQQFAFFYVTLESCVQLSSAGGETFCLHNRSSNAFRLGVLFMHLRIPRQKGRKDLHFCINDSITVRNFLGIYYAPKSLDRTDLQRPQRNCAASWVLRAFVRLTCQRTPCSDHTPLTQHVLCNMFVRELRKEVTGEFDRWESCTRSSIPLYAENITPGTCGSHPSCLPWKWAWLGWTRIVFLKSQGTSLELPGCSYEISLSQHPKLSGFWDWDLLWWLFQ